MTREERYIEYDERINRYLRNQMSDSERDVFEQDVDNDHELRERLVATSLLVQGIAQEGMRREGRAQLDAIKQMSLDEYLTATQDDSAEEIRAMIQIDYDDDIADSSDRKVSRPIVKLMKWASGIAAIAIVAYGLYIFYPHSSRQQPKIAETVKKTPTKPAKSKKPTEPTLASLADKYNKPFGSEPDEFVDIRKQIMSSGSKDMMAVVYDIDKVEWPTAKHGPKGADDEEEFKETQKNYEDCTHWYKALAYLKANDEDSAMSELKELIDHGQIDELIKRAKELLDQLER